MDEFKPTYAMVWPHMNVSEEYTVWEVDGTDSVECDHIEHTLTIRADGTIVPCCYDLTSKLPMGNILTDDIKELFTGSKYQYLRELIMNKNYPDLCANCNVVRPRKYLVPRWRSRSLEQADYL